MPSLTLANSLRATITYSPFTPSSLFTAGVQGAWYDPSDINLNWRYNLLTYTEQFDNAAWIKYNSTATANTVLAPDGTLTADTFTTTAAVSAIYRNVTVSGQNYWSLPAKQGTNRYLALVVGDSVADAGYVVFDLQDGVVGQTVSGTLTTGVSGTISTLPNGFFKCTIVYTRNIGGNHKIELAPSLAGNTLDAFGEISGNTVGRTIYIWGASLTTAANASLPYQQIVTPEISYLTYQPQPVLFQDSAGTTPVTAVEQPVGLMLDKSQGLVASTKGGFFPRINASNIKTPAAATALAFTGDFTIETRVNLSSHPAGTAAEFLVKGFGAAYDYRFYMTAGGSLVLSVFDTGGTQRAYIASSSISIIGGSTTWLKVTLDVDNGAGSSVAKFYQSSDGVTYTQIGTDRTVAATYTIRNTANSVLILGMDADSFSQAMLGKMYRCIFKSGIDGPTVADFNPTLYTGGATFTAATGEVWTINGSANITPDGNHAFQSTSASRPVLSARYNLLTKTEEFNDAAWTKTDATVTANAATAPDGTTTADLLIETAATGNHRVSQTAGTLQAQTLMVSISHKAGVGTRNLDFAIVGGGNFVSSVFSTATGEVLANNDFAGVIFSGKQNTVSGPDAQGFYTATITVNLLSAQSVSVVYGLANGTSNNYTGNGTSGIYIWGADLKPTNQSTLPYQRVNTSTDYATTGFLPYLKFDGVDDSMSTNSINFTSTDKMSVFAGVRKLSDAARAVAVDLSASPFINAGSFGVELPNDATGTRAFFLNGSQLGQFYTAPATAPKTEVLSISYDIGNAVYTTEIVPRSNGSILTATSGVAAGTGNFGNYPLFIGRRNNASLPFNGQMYSMTIVGKQVTATELSSTETYTAIKTGVTLA